jgi:hypothetical protein
VSFEVEVVQRTGCKVHAFDPSVGTLPHYAGAHADLHPAITFHKQALGSWSGHSTTWMLIETLTDTMKRLGHDYIDILKVDIEGDEWGVFAALIAELGAKNGEDGALQLPFGQLLIELHYKDMPSTFDFFFGMKR